MNNEELDQLALEVAVECGFWHKDTAEFARRYRKAIVEKMEPSLWGCKFTKGNRIDTFHSEGAANACVKSHKRNDFSVELVSLYLLENWK